MYTDDVAPAAFQTALRSRRAVVLLAVYAVAQVGLIRHLAFTEHEVCAEHKAVHHPGSSDEPGAPSGPDEHEDCTPLAWRGNPVLVEDGTQALMGPEVATAGDRGLVQARPRAAIQLLFLAPKLSPPLA